MSRIEGKELWEASPLKKVITFSNWQDEIGNLKNSSGPGEVMSIYNDEFDENSSMNDRVIYGHYKFLGDNVNEVKASKNIMQVEYLSKTQADFLFPHNPKDKNRWLSARSKMPIFGLQNGKNIR